MARFNNVDVSANKARCLLLAQANAQDSFTGADGRRTAADQGIFLSGHNMHKHTHLLFLAGLTALPAGAAIAADEPQATLEAVTVTATRRGHLVELDSGEGRTVELDGDHAHAIQVEIVS